MNQRELFCTLGGNVNWYGHYGEQYGESSKTRNKLPYDPTIPLLGIHPEVRFHHWKRHMYPNVHCSTIYITRTWKQPRCPSTDEWIQGLWYIHTIFSSVQLLSCVRLFATPWTTAHQASLSITSSRSLPKLISIESVMPSSHLILCCPLHLLPSIPPSIRVFSKESTLCMRWPKY